MKMISQIREEREKRLGRIYFEESTSLAKLGGLFSKLSSDYNMDYGNIAAILKKRQSYASIPASIFNNVLSPLENVVLYLSVRYRFNQTKIAEILCRDHTTIWTTLENAQQKINRLKYTGMIDKLPDSEKILVPVKIFSDRKLSILEDISMYMKDRFNMSYHEIAIVLGKNDRTIWTVVNRGWRKIKA